MTNQELIKSLKETDYYLKCKEVINDLNAQGLLDRGVGYCVSMSDIVMKLLHKKGIECELVECSVMIMVKDPPLMGLIGYEGLSHIEDFVHNMESHVVCVTKTPIPLLIDASLKNFDPNVPCICIPITESKSSNLAEYDFGTSAWTYQKKSDSKLPWLHQQSVLHRIVTDYKTEKELKFLKLFLIAISIVTSLNFIRGSFDFHQKYFVIDNNFGPERIKKD
jgi:hypothetical protein